VDEQVGSVHANALTCQILDFKTYFIEINRIDLIYLTLKLDSLSRD